MHNSQDNCACNKKVRYIEVEIHLGIMTHEHITVHISSYEKVRTFKHVGSLITNQNHYLW